MTFSEFIAETMESRAVWAGRLGISQSYMSDLLNGNKTPSLVVAAKIERLTGGAVRAVSWVPTDIPATGYDNPPRAKKADAA